MKVIAVSQSATKTLDEKMMRRCIELSKMATREGEFPFSAVICQDGEIVAETTNRVGRDADVTKHAEVLAISEAQRVLGTTNLERCTLYTNVEPCPMCSFPIRETRMRKVVYAIRSPLMGGDSKWNVLADEEISKVMPEGFGAAPEIVAGILRRDAERVWRNWNPIIWGVVRYRGCLGGDGSADVHTAAFIRGFLRKLLLNGSAWFRTIGRKARLRFHL
jgi:tRNA(adenine34) deaminase